MGHAHGPSLQPAKEIVEGMMREAVQVIQKNNSLISRL